jgi:hypothetical protein
VPRAKKSGRRDQNAGVEERPSTQHRLAALQRRYRLGIVGRAPGGLHCHRRTLHLRSRLARRAPCPQLPRRSAARTSDYAAARACPSSRRRHWACLFERDPFISRKLRRLHASRQAGAGFLRPLDGGPSVHLLSRPDASLHPAELYSRDAGTLHTWVATGARRGPDTVTHPGWNDLIGRLRRLETDSTPEVEQPRPADGARHAICFAAGCASSLDLGPGCCCNVRALQWNKGAGLQARPPSCR